MLELQSPYPAITSFLENKESTVQLSSYSLKFGLSSKMRTFYILCYRNGTQEAEDTAEGC